MILIIGLGIFPKPVVDIIKPAVESTMQQVGVTDPAPEIPVTEGQKVIARFGRWRTSPRRRSSTASWRRCSIVFGAACVGVLVEAFLPRPLRHLVQLAIVRRGARRRRAC